MLPLARRNVTLRDHDGNVLAGFWQYGSISWISFSTWLSPLVIQTDHQWVIFDLEEDSPGRRGAQRPLGPTIVPLGNYILLQQDGSPLQVALTRETARPRQPTHANTSTRLDHYCNRARDRDDKCLITSLPDSWSRLKAAHIFPRTHVTEWLRKGYHNPATDTAPAIPVGGHSRIDSIQNVLMLRSDLRDAWANYEYGINPDDNYRITAFINGLSDVHGLVLHLDHIADPTIRPLDGLFRDHFLQGVLTHVKGAGEPAWDYDDAFSDGAFDLSRQEV